MDNTDPKSLLVYHNRTSTAPKYTQNISAKANVLGDIASTEEGSDDEPVVNRRSTRYVKRGTNSRKTSMFTISGGSISGRSSSVGVKWRVLGDDDGTGEVVTVTAEQMTNAEKLALELGMSEDILIENAGSVRLCDAG